LYRVRKINLLFIVTALIVLGSYSYSQKSEDYELTSISFIGNNTFSTSTLSDKIRSNETPWWFYKFLDSFSALGAPPVYFNSMYVPSDSAALKSFYGDNGFFLANISTEYDIDTSAHTAKILYKINENKPFNYNQIIFYGLDNITSSLQDNIKSNFDINYSDRYTESEVALKIAQAISTLKDSGYMNASFDSTLINIDTVKAAAGIYIYFYAGSRYKLSEINIVKTGIGKDEVNDEVIKNLTAFEKDEYFNLSKIQKGQSRLYSTEIFNSALIEASIKDTSDSYVPLQIKGDIGEMNELYPELIMNDKYGEFNLGLGGNYKRKNFLGNARRLWLNVQGLILDVATFNPDNLFKRRANRDSTFQGEITASIKLDQPYIFDEPISASLESYYESTTIEKNFYLNYGIKASLNFERPIYRFINILVPYFNLDYITYIPNLKELNLGYDESSFTTAFGTQLGSSKTDNLFYPTKGYNLSFNVEGATSKTQLDLEGQDLYDAIGINKLSVSERAWFYVFQATASFYSALSLDRKTVYGTKFKLGYIQTIEGRDELIPPNRTFYAGGASSVRGWRSRELVPLDSIPYFGINSDDILRGGTFLLEGSFELRNKFADNLGYVLFTDYGNTWNGYKLIKLSEVAIAVGFGFRYYTSILPFRVDFGFKFYDPYSKQFMWNNWHPNFWHNLEFHFGIGEAF
jgi:outer membrane protein insertion porin family